MKIHDYEKLTLGKVYKFENVRKNKIDYFIDTNEKRFTYATSIDFLENCIIAIFLGVVNNNLLRLLYKGKIIYFYKNWINKFDVEANEVFIDSKPKT